MPRRSKGARLYLRAERRDQKGKLTERANWVIRDGKRYVPTGRFAGTPETKPHTGAEQVLAIQAVY